MIWRQLVISQTACSVCYEGGTKFHGSTRERGKRAGKERNARSREEQEQRWVGSCCVWETCSSAMWQEWRVVRSGKGWGARWGWSLPPVMLKALGIHQRFQAGSKASDLCFRKKMEWSRASPVQRLLQWFIGSVTELDWGQWEWNGGYWRMIWTWKPICEFIMDVNLPNHWDD